MDCMAPSNHKQSFLGNPERLPGSTIPTQVLEAPDFSHDIHTLVKRKPTLESLGFSRGAVRKLGVGVHAGAGCVCPASLVWGPGGDRPSPSLNVMAGNVRGKKQLVVVCLNLESGEFTKHHTVLNSEIIQRRLAAIAKPHVHDQASVGPCHTGSKRDPVGKKTLHAQRMIGVPRPFGSFQSDGLFIPDRGNVGMGQVGQSQIRPDGLGDIQYSITASFPGSKGTDLGFALRIDGPVQKPNAGMAASRVGKDE